MTVTLDEAFVEPTVTLPITVTANGGAVEADYSGIPEELTFAPGDTEKTFTVTVVDDAEDDDGESLTLSFGEEAHIRPGGTDETATITLTDNDRSEVEFGASAYTVAEDAPQSITVTLNADPERTLIIPIEATGRQDGATAADYSVPPSFTFNDGEMSKSFTFTATQDNIDDDNESVQLGFGTMPDSRVSPGTTDDVTLSITDDDTAALVVSGGDYAGLVSRLPVTVTDDDTGALRLVDGNFTDENGRLCEGRLEIFYNGAWWAARGSNPRPSACKADALTS